MARILQHHSIYPYAYIVWTAISSTCSIISFVGILILYTSVTRNRVRKTNIVISQTIHYITILNYILHNKSQLCKAHTKLWSNFQLFSNSYLHAWIMECWMVKQLWMVQWKESGNVCPVYLNLSSHHTHGATQELHKKLHLKTSGLTHKLRA
jgi:hypothetical protein